MYGASLGRMPMNVVYRLSEPDDRTMWRWHVTSSFMGTFMPPVNTVMQWKSQLEAYNKATNWYVYVENAGQLFDLGRLQDILRLHKACEIKSAVAQEIQWFSTGHLIPSNVKRTPPEQSISNFQSLLYNPRYDAINPGTGMSAEELSKLCCRRWLSGDYMHKLNSNKLNSMQWHSLYVSEPNWKCWSLCGQMPSWKHTSPKKSGVPPECWEK